MNSSLFLILLHSLTSHGTKSQIKAFAVTVSSYNVTPFVFYDSSDKPFSGIEYNLIETIAKRLNLQLKYEKVNLLNGSRIADNNFN